MPARDAPEAARPAFYALRPGGWRDYVTLLHLPYTAWHLSYVVVGGCLASRVHWWTLGLTVLSFALALGIGAHALDELAGRPLATAIPSRVLVGLAIGSVVTASAIGIVVALERSLWIVPLVAIGAALVPVYNLELLGGRVHSDLGFALAWGAFPLATAYVAQTGAFRAETALAAAWATLLSLAQRKLSTPIRRARRELVGVAGHVELADGRHEPLDRAALIAAPETALKLLTAATIGAAAALLALRL